MNRFVLTSAACALALGLAACGSGGNSNATPDAGAPTQDGGASSMPDAGPPPTQDAGPPPTQDAGTVFTPGIQYNGSIAFEKVTQ